MHARKRMARGGGGGAWCGELAAHSPEREGRVKAVRRGSSRKKQLSHHSQHQSGWSGERHSLVADSARGQAADLYKRVMVVVDASQESKLALKWALSHVVQPMDVLTLLHVQPHAYPRLSYSPHGSFFNAKAVEETRRKNEVAGWELANQFKTMVATCRPEVEVEILVVEGDKGPTIVAQAKKLEVSVLVIGQRKPSVLWRFMRNSIPKRPVAEEKERQLGRILYKQLGLLDTLREEEEQAAGWIPDQQSVAEEFLASGVIEFQQR